MNSAAVVVMKERRVMLFEVDVMVNALNVSMHCDERNKSLTLWKWLQNHRVATLCKGCDNGRRTVWNKIIYMTSIKLLINKGLFKPFTLWDFGLTFH